MQVIAFRDAAGNLHVTEAAMISANRNLHKKQVVATAKKLIAEQLRDDLNGADLDSRHRAMSVFDSGRQEAKYVIYRSIAEDMFEYPDDWRELVAKVAKLKG